jgi:hypothetical protein
VDAPRNGLESLRAADGIVGWALARRKTPGFGLLVGGVLVCLVALILDSVVAGLGLELVRFQALR